MTTNLRCDNDLGGGSLCYDAGMRPRRLLVALGTVLVMGLLLPLPARAADPPALARARALYNAADYDGAIDSAATAQRLPASADAAGLVMARAHLERYRRNVDPAELASAREALSAVRIAALTPRDQLDLLVGLGQSLFFGDVFGASAELFETALDRDVQLTARERQSLLDWWASALDREAQGRAADRRSAAFARMVVKMENELRLDPGNAPANYWLAVAARGIGDIDRAWDAALAGWVRSNLNPDTAPTLRTDLDRLVTQALIPERVRTQPAAQQADATTTFRAEWDLVKEQWK